MRNKIHLPFDPQFILKPFFNQGDIFFYIMILTETKL